MLSKRLLFVIFMIPIGIALISFGGIPYLLFLAITLGIAAWEYCQLFKKCDFSPSIVLVIGGTGALIVQRAWSGFNGADILLSLLILASMTYHLVDYERGRNQAATDFGITVGGIFYIGWLGAYLVSLRGLPEGKWWVLLALPAVWLADGGAYFIGSRFGRRHLSPRLSPKKTWEGYFGGVLFGILGGALLAAFWHLMSPPVTAMRGAIMGLVLASLTPLGDLGESMFKRQAGMKDSSNIIPGHGGILDRYDSWLWAGVLGYYVIQWLQFK
ncbi:MAG TPA: phosphatidate cytidylyltransferase [Anaerolineaceae bacterium]